MVKHLTAIHRGKEKYETGFINGLLPLSPMKWLSQNGHVNSQAFFNWVAIPNEMIKLRTGPPLASLENFGP